MKNLQSLLLLAFFLRSTFCAFGAFTFLSTLALFAILGNVGGIVLCFYAFPRFNPFEEGRTLLGGGRRKLDLEAVGRGGGRLLVLAYAVLFHFLVFFNFKLHGGAVHVNAFVPKSNFLRFL